LPNQTNINSFRSSHSDTQVAAVNTESLPLEGLQGRRLKSRMRGSTSLV